MIEAAVVPSRPAAWKIVLAFGLVYVAWSTTYLAIKEGVKTLPPALFAGTRLASAGLLLLGYLVLRREPLRLSRRDLLATIIAGVCLFVGGNGLITVAETTVDSGMASVLVATTPVWIALAECLWPWGERLSLRGWLGVLIGLAGVLVLLVPKLSDPRLFFHDTGPLLVLGSAGSWAIGSLVLRYGRRGGSHLTSASYQMIVGGMMLSVIGWLRGEAKSLTAESFTFGGVFSFFYLLVVGSLIGFLAYSWLLQHVSATQAGTYAYVNPALAVLVGWLFGEEVTIWVAAGLVVILGGVALVRGGQAKPSRSRCAVNTVMATAPKRQYS